MPGSSVTAPAAPSAPTNLSASVGAGRVVTLRWTDISNNEAPFSVERAPKAKLSSPLFRVQASNAIGNSPYSNTVTVRAR
jgi:hypothetical protein